MRKNTTLFLIMCTGGDIFIGINVKNSFTSQSILPVLCFMGQSSGFSETYYMVLLVQLAVEKHESGLVKVECHHRARVFAYVLPVLACCGRGVYSRRHKKALRPCAGGKAHECPVGVLAWCDIAKVVPFAGHACRAVGLHYLRFPAAGCHVFARNAPVATHYGRLFRPYIVGQAEHKPVHPSGNAQTPRVTAAHSGQFGIGVIHVALVDYSFYEVVGKWRMHSVAVAVAEAQCPYVYTVQKGMNICHIAAKILI